MMTSSVTHRIASIDIFRALTMLMMIFVNDLWTLTGIPGWLEHTATHTDGMGLADTVFPAFLVVMGMSVPYAVQSRLDKGQGRYQILKHIVARSFALIVMGVYTVNAPSVNAAATGISGAAWEFLSVICFFLVWNVYPLLEGNRKYFFRGLQGTGIIGLLILALIYRGHGENIQEILYFRPQWWGILGLIGWAYLGCAVLYLYFKDYLIVLLACFLFFAGFNIAGHAGILGKGEWFVGNGAFHTFTFAGIFCSLFLEKMKRENRLLRFLPYAFGAGFLSILLGFLLRHYFIISKNLATPSWVFICIGISLVVFSCFFYLVDIRGKGNWFSYIKPAGTHTLTCYLIPYLVYNFMGIYRLKAPDAFSIGLAGILKSVVFAFLVIQVTKMMARMKVKIRI